MQRDGTGKVKTGGLSPKVSPVAACTTLVTIDTNGHLFPRIDEKIAEGLDELLGASAA